MAKTKPTELLDVVAEQCFGQWKQHAMHMLDQLTRIQLGILQEPVKKWIKMTGQEFSDLPESKKDEYRVFGAKILYSLGLTNEEPVYVSGAFKNKARIQVVAETPQIIRCSGCRSLNFCTNSDKETISPFFLERCYHCGRPFAGQEIPVPKEELVT